MKKEISVWPAVLSILGTLIGAGFASGAEILAFFGRFGVFSWALSVVFFAITFFGIWFFLNLGQKFGSMAQANKFLYNKFAFFPQLVFELGYFIIFSNMLAGARLMLGGSIALYIVFVLATFVALAFGLSSILKINSFLLPLLLGFLLVAPILFLCNNPCIAKPSVAFPLALASSATYSGTNLAVSAVLVAELGKNIPKSKHLSVASIATAILVPIFVLLLVALSNLPKASQAQPIPILALVPRGNMANFVRICLLLATATTLLSCGYPLAKRAQMITKNRFSAAAIVLCAGMAMSCFGFSNIIAFLYPALGVFGLLYFFVSIILAAKHKKESAKRAP